MVAVLVMAKGLLIAPKVSAIDNSLTYICLKMVGNEMEYRYQYRVGNQKIRLKILLSQPVLALLAVMKLSYLLFAMLSVVAIDFEVRYKQL